MSAFFLALAIGLSASELRAAQPYAIVDTSQAKCYDDSGEIAPPKPSEPFYGQDAQFHSHPASYTLSADGLTVRDLVTGLTWQRSPDTDGDGVLTRRDKLTLAQAQELPAKLDASKFGGFNDWRLPSIKELYSLLDARGTDPSGPMNADTSRLTPYLDTKYFKFAYGDATGERVIDSQGPQGRESGDYHFVDVHGAGSQRSDPKAGDPGMFPHGRGPQGDVIRIYNYVRLVRRGPAT